jgi:hypothetical protein
MSGKCTECGGPHPWWNHSRPAGYIFGDAPLESYMDENLSTETGGVEITTRGQRRRLMERQHLEYHRNRFVGSVGEGRRQYYDQGSK